MLECIKFNKDSNSNAPMKKFKRLQTLKDSQPIQTSGAQSKFGKILSQDDDIKLITSVIEKQDQNKKLKITKDKIKKAMNYNPKFRKGSFYAFIL